MNQSKVSLRQAILVMCAAGVMLVATGCQTLQPQGIVTDPIENYGGGGGD